MQTASVTAESKPPFVPPPPAGGSRLPTPELDALAGQLETRRSVVNLARAWVLGCASVIIVGVSTHLAIDAGGLPFYVWPGFAVGGGCVLVSLGSLIRGFGLLRGEREAFARYVALRAEAGLEDSRTGI